MSKKMTRITFLTKSNAYQYLFWRARIAKHWLAELEVFKSKTWNLIRKLSFTSPAAHSNFFDSKTPDSILLIAKSKAALGKEIQFFQNQFGAAFKKFKALKKHQWKLLYKTRPIRTRGKVAFVFQVSALLTQLWERYLSAFSLNY